MAHLVLIHGAFRSGGAWDDLRTMLDAAGHASVAPTLSRTPQTVLADWVDEVTRLVHGAPPSESVVLVGHSQGGFVARVAAEVCGDRLAMVAFIDAAVPEDGERACDLLPGVDRTRLTPPPAGTMIAPPGDGAGRVAEPAAPSFEPVALKPLSVPVRHLFCAQTAATFPCATTRARLDATRAPYDVIDAPHDAPTTHPELVAPWLIDAISRTTT